MSSVFDYVKKYNVSFLEKEFNEVDNLIFSRFAYIKFDGILSFSDMITIKELYKKYCDFNIKKADKDTVKLFGMIAKSRRYSDLIVGNYLSVISAVEEKQFSAITFYLPDNKIYISFRGTDDNLVSFKEDFNMTYMTHVPSQLDSVKYLEAVMKKTDCEVMVGGHSKGGNMAMYSASFCNSNFRKRISKVYNNDGPGFFDEILESKGYKECLDRILTFVPQTSIVGMLLNHKEKYTVVKSRKSLIMQHDLLSWEIDDDKFVVLKSVNKKSKYINDTMSSLLLLSKDEKKKFFDIIYQMLVATGAKTTTEISKDKIKNVKIVLNNYKMLNEDDKVIFLRVWREIVEMSKNNITHYLPRTKKETEKV